MSHPCIFVTTYLFDDKKRRKYCQHITRVDSMRSPSFFVRRSDMLGLKHRLALKFALGAWIAAYSVAASAALTLYSDDDFRGLSITVQGATQNLKRVGMNDQASSAIVTDGSWVVCEHESFGGKCVVLGPGSYRSLRQYDLNDAVTSARPTRRGESNRPVVLPSPPPEYYDWYHRPNERLFQAPVIAARAVYGTAEQRCWGEHTHSGSANAGGAVIGAIIGGIIGHQIGGGSGRDAATAGGAVAGAAIGSQSGRGLPYSREVRRCENVSSGRPLYWDVTYNFRGQDHFVQMNRPPGPTVTVNRAGEPRE
jgi:hypothetical protein